MIDKLTFITGNASKAEQLAKYLGIPVEHQKIDLDEIQSLDLEKIVEHKARQAYEKVKKPVLVDDTSLKINGLGNLPGPFIKFFLNEMGEDKICQIAHLSSDTSATTEVMIGLYDGKELKIFKGEVTGQISDKKRGDRGFGWDFLFIPKGYNQTRAEMNEEDYDQTSPRKIALEKLERYLKDAR